MIEVKLPLGNSVFVCETCGNSPSNTTQKKACEAVPITEEPDVKIGDRVKIFKNVWQDDRCKGLSASPSEYSVYRLYYAPPGEIMMSTLRRVDRHTLCVTLRASFDQTRGWVPSDAGYVEANMTYQDFLLWRKGDRAELEEARMVLPPKKPKRPLLVRVREGFPLVWQS